MTKSGRALLLVVLTALSLLLVAAPVLGTEEAPAEEAPAGEEEPETVVTTDIEPAVEVTTPPADLATEDWTYRYLVPTGIALAILVIIATTGQYFTNVVRKRYRIVEE